MTRSFFSNFLREKKNTRDTLFRYSNKGNIYSRAKLKKKNGGEKIGKNAPVIYYIYVDNPSVSLSM